MKRFIMFVLSGIVLGSILGSGPARAQGILYLHEPGEIFLPQPPDERIIPPPRPPRLIRTQAAELRSLEVQVEIEGQTATTVLDQTFRNPNNRRVEGTYMFPLPPDAVIRDMSLHIDGKPVQCEVVEAQKARKIYEDIVRKARDPALLEYVGRDLVRLRIFPIEPNQTRRVAFKYSQILKREFGLTEFTFPLVGRQQAERPIGQVSVSGSIDADAPIVTVYSPTHDVEFRHIDPRTCKFGFEATNHKPATHLRILYAVSEKELGASLVTYRADDDGDGFFMLMIAPGVDSQKKDPIPKDVLFVFDTSGSMGGEKIEQAKGALRYCLHSLNPDDRFNIVRFSTDTESFTEKLTQATKKTIQDALEFVDDFTARGGTAIDAAIQEALNVPGDEGRPRLVVFLTDGLPTVGETNPDRIIDSVKSKTDESLRIFPFGVGHDVDTRLLDSIAAGAGGTSDYVAPKEDIEVKVSNFFQKVANPILTDLSIDYGDIRVKDVYPRRAPDVFHGSQIKLIGRYQGAGQTTLVAKGRRGDDKRVMEYHLKFPEHATGADYLPRLWAIRRVGHLVDEIRRNGENTELKDEVIRLGKKYAIATPYTSMLVLEDNADIPRLARGRQPMIAGDADGSGFGSSGLAFGYQEPRRRLNEWGSDLSSASGASGRTDAYVAGPMDSVSQTAPALKAKTGSAAVAMSRITNEMKQREKADGLELEEQQARQVAGRVFRQTPDQTWIDSAWDGKAQTIDIEYGSDEYFDLLAKGDAIGKFLALGTKVIFTFDGKWYRITEPTEAEQEEGPEE